jgi:hypothetical protein
VRASDRIDAVLPLTLADARRAQILFRSLDSLFEPLGTCYVVAPDHEVTALRRMLPRHAYELVPESALIPEIGYFRTTARVRARLRIVGPPIHGWYVQQLVKLAVANRVGTPFYLTLDSDVICVRPTRYDDLVRDGRALFQTSPPNHPEWNDDAERVLALPRSGRQYGVTPAVFATDAVKSLATHLERRVDPRLRRVAAGAPEGIVRDVLASWRSFVLRNLPCTEYALYFTFLERTGALDAYHVHGGFDAIYSNCVWMESEFDAWDPEPDTESTYRFSVVQSATRIDPDHVWARVEPLFSRSSTKRATAASSERSSRPRSLPSAL